MSGENTTAPILYTVDDQRYRPELGLEYSFGRHRINLSGEVSFRHNSSTRLKAADVNSRDFKYGVTGVFKLPYDFGISTDIFMYQRRGYDTPQFNTNELVWNTRLSKSFCKGRWLLAVDGFDILHRLTSVYYSISSWGRVETYTNTLPRYILFHAQYKINIMPKKKELSGKAYSY